MYSFRNAVMVSAVVMAMLPSTSVLAANMTKDQIATQIVGKTLNAKRMGMSVTIHYNTDGSVSMKFPIFSGSGSWVYKDDGICMDLKSGPKKGKTCVTFEHLGGNKYKNSEGIEFTISSE